MERKPNRTEHHSSALHRIMCELQRDLLAMPADPMHTPGEPLTASQDQARPCRAWSVACTCDGQQCTAGAHAHTMSKRDTR